MCVFKYHAFIFYIRPPRWRCKTSTIDEKCKYTACTFTALWSRWKCILPVRSLYNGTAEVKRYVNIQPIHSPYSRADEHVYCLYIHYTVERGRWKKCKYVYSLYFHCTVNTVILVNINSSWFFNLKKLNDFFPISVPCITFCIASLAKRSEECWANAVSAPGQDSNEGYPARANSWATMKVTLPKNFTNLSLRTKYP